MSELDLGEREEGRRGVELALDGGDASLLALRSEGANEGTVGVLVRSDEPSVSVS
jgi:hypothetical protein